MKSIKVIGDPQTAAKKLNVNKKFSIGTIFNVVSDAIAASLVQECPTVFAYCDNQSIQKGSSAGVVGTLFGPGANKMLKRTASFKSK